MRFTASTRRSRTHFLLYVERGTIRLIRATTENPSFEIISALLSRCRVYVLQPLSEHQIAHAPSGPRRPGARPGCIGADRGTTMRWILIASYSSGDCRNAYNTLDGRNWRKSPLRKQAELCQGTDFSRAVAAATNGF